MVVLSSRSRARSFPLSLEFTSSETNGSVWSLLLQRLMVLCGLLLLRLLLLLLVCWSSTIPDYFEDLKVPRVLSLFVDLLLL